MPDDDLDEETARAFSRTLARSLRVFATIPRPIAEAHMRLRGYDAPGSDASDAEVRGALLKALSDEVLLEREATLRGETFDPYVNAQPGRIRRGAGGAQSRSGSRETRGKVLGSGAGSDDDGSAGDSDSSVGGAYVPRDESEDESEEYSDDDGDDDDDDESSGDEYDDDDEDDEADIDEAENFFGRAAAAPPAPAGANPFANDDFNLDEEARVQIVEAKRIVAARRAQANDLSEAFTSLNTSEGALSPQTSGRVNFSDKGDDVASIAGSIAASDITDRFDVISLVSVAGTLGSDATDRFAEVEDDLRALGGGRAEVIYESSDEGFVSDDDDPHQRKENSPPDVVSP